MLTFRYDNGSVVMCKGESLSFNVRTKMFLNTVISCLKFASEYSGRVRGGRGDAIDEKGGRGLADGCMGRSWVMEMGDHYTVFSLAYVSNFFIAEV